MRARVRPCPADPVTEAPGVGECHVWVIDLNCPPVAADLLASLLTEDERARAERYRVKEVRDQFTLARGALRRLLGGYLDLAPQRVPIVVAAGGKPELASGGLHFNLTHTPGLALVAVAGVRVGVDAEKRRTIPDADGLVKRFFSPAERAVYHDLSAAVRPDAFYRGWVCKEAVIKAAGATMHVLDAFDVELDPARPAAVLAARHPQLAGSAWAVADWCPAPGYSAAVAVEDDSVELV
ncbi:4'-phosphopantetheinyl transferase family protein [Urbifossiella limnaea]|uniref:Holo-(Acyl carrier protein) synthase 2 n=1 Tax=Urbifossiella limnaea TaxID=2528023 RepID=A0A517XVG2_9BACT|nr:4'-phosphopantetheinyl transferase superfamily protein [Urbifossiella limnaea]QDU21505.1 holo-(acyl carrier protein) synthase 2 [Urbifossiella limnaea]